MAKKSLFDAKHLAAQNRIARRAINEGNCEKALEEVMHFEVVRAVRDTENRPSGAGRHGNRGDWKVTVGASMNLRRDFAAKCLKRKG